uniref:NADH dehydrogenase subunit 2 n=1 Tax=Cyathocotyle prussica TaxID=2067575 RepID=A0A6J3YMF2_9TREM|nr:NADH dehydrogenase subunit 2 [Cyathocotyle prussica]AYH51387.1 NADH dehydrogenase subunit 2 [Cyathocotyle prussica]
MGGWLLSSVIGFSGFSLFSICLFFSKDLVFFWLFLELSGLCLMPCFFLSVGSGSFISLFTYIVVSSISSSMMLAGILYGELVFFFLIGLLIKFGFFPFLGWLYIVNLNTNWLIIWCLSTLSKVPFIFVCFFLSGLMGAAYVSVSLFGCLTLIFLSLVFWVYTYSWRACWTHMMVSSSVLLVLMSFCVSIDLLGLFFLIYVVWCSFTILYLASLESLQNFGGGNSGNGLSIYVYIFLLLSTPVSLSLFYKLMMSYCVFSCGLLLVLCWVIYSVSEQFYLIKFLVSACLPKDRLDYITLV